MARFYNVCEIGNTTDRLMKKVEQNAVFIISPMQYLTGTEFEEDANNMLAKLYDKNILDIGIAREFVQLAVMSGCADYMAFSYLYSALHAADRSNFKNLISKILTLANNDVKTVNETESQQQKKQSETAEVKQHKQEPKPEASVQQQSVQKQNQQKPTQQNGSGKMMPGQQYTVQYQQPVEAAKSAKEIIGQFVAGSPNRQFGQQQVVTQQVPTQQQMPGVAYDPMPGANIGARVAEMQKNVKLIKGAHPGVNASQINALIMMRNNGALKKAVRNIGGDADNMVFEEIKMGANDKAGGFDFKFKVQGKDGNVVIFLFNSVQEWNPSIGAYINKMSIVTPHTHH